MPAYYKIPLIYFGAALTWVLGSDALLFWLTPELSQTLDRLKGTAFVFVTTLLLIILLKAQNYRRNRVEANLKAILDGMSDIYYRCDNDGRLEVISNQVIQSCGYRPEELIGTDVSTLYVDPVERIRLLGSLEVNGGQVVDHEVQLRHKDGSVLWVSASSHFVKDGADKVVGVEGMLRVIDGRKKAESALKEAANLVEDLLNTSPDATMLLERDGRLLAANRVMAQRFGLDLKNIGTMSVWSLFPEDVAAVRKRKVMEVVSTGQPVTMSDIRGGRFFENCIYPVRGGDGRISKVAVFSRDVTELRRTERELQEREETYRAVFENTAVAKLRTDPDTGAILDANKAAAAFYGWSRERLCQMRVSDLNLWGPDRTSQEMNQVRQGHTTSFQARHRVSSGQIRDVEVHSSPIRVRGQTFLHSIIIDITDRLRAERELNAARLQAEASVRAELAFISRMSGELRTPLNGILGMTRLLSESPLATDQRDWVSSIGQCNMDLMGILDELMLFSSTAKAADTSPESSSEAHIEAEQLDIDGMKPLSILLAEDNYINQKVTEAILSKRGHHVTTVGDGVEAVKIMEKETFDLVLMDVQMPVRDGLWAARTLREQGYNVPIMALTAQAMPRDAELCLQAGMNAFIPKPFTAEQLMQEIGRLMQVR